VGKDSQGKRDGTGPYKGSYQRGKTGSKEKRLIAGVDPPPRIKASKLRAKLKQLDIAGAATRERTLRSKMRQRIMRKWYKRKKRKKK